MFRICLLSVMLAATLAVSADARTWTYHHGVSFKAEFVRLVGDMAVLKQDGKTITIALADLVDNDQAWLRCADKCAKTRDWTTFENKVIRGRYDSYYLGRVTLRTRTGKQEVALEDLVEEDRRLVTTMNGIPMIEGKPRKSLKEAPLVKPTAEDADGFRVWTATNGKKIAAKYRGKEGDTVILFYNDREYRVPLSRLTEADRAYANMLSTEDNGVRFDDLEHEDPLHDLTADSESEDKEGAVADNWSSEDEPSDIRVVKQGNGRRRVWADGVEVFGAEADRIAAILERRQRELKVGVSNNSTALFEEHRRAHQEAMQAHEEHVAKVREEQLRRARELEKQREERRAEAEQRAAERRTTQAAQAANTYEYECFSCNKTFESSKALGVGDKCPHCHVKFDSLSDENGNIIDESSTLKARRTAGIIKLVVFGVLGIGGFLGWLAKRG